MKLKDLNRGVSILGLSLGLTLGFSFCFNSTTLATDSSVSRAVSPNPPKPGNSVAKPAAKTVGRFPASIPIQPKEETGREIKEPAYFIIKNENHRYYLKWVTKDPHFYLNLKAPLFIQLITQHPIQISPAYVSLENWPKTGDQLELKVTGATTKTDNRLLGKASYSYCNSSTQKCTQALLPLIYRIQP